MYYSELVRVVNTATHETKYYVIKCDTRTRITRTEYNRRYDSAEGVSTLHQRSRMYRGVEYIHFFTTVIYEQLSSIQF